jgi:hypothetical protein
MLRIRLVSLIFGTSLLTACFHDSRASDDLRSEIGYEKGTVYVLSRTAHAELMKAALSNEVSSLNLLDDDHYERFAGNHALELVELPIGTRIRVVDVWKTWNFEAGDRVEVVARVDSGPYKDKPANLDWISGRRPKDPIPKNSLPFRNPEYLVKAFPNQSPDPTLSSGTAAAGQPARHP